jgi:hypothetical protein
MRTKLSHFLRLGIIMGLISAARAFADIILYLTPGTQTPTSYTFTAASTGDIIAYFDGSGASYSEDPGLEIDGVPTGVTGLNNHSTAIGTALDLGSATAGDTLTFSSMSLPPATPGIRTPA